MATALYESAENKGRRRAIPTGGNGWAGTKHIRLLSATPGDVAYHQTEELLLGSVLPEKWGGPTTSRAVDARLTNCYESQARDGNKIVLYTEWTEIDLISGFTEDFWTTYEVTGSGGRIGTEERFDGERRCVILNSEVGTLAPYYNVALGADHVFPGATGNLPAHLTKYRLRPMAERPLCSMLTMYYTEPTIFQALTPNRAILMVDVSSVEVKKTRDDNNDVITGPDKTDAGAKWVLATGSNIELVPGAIVKIKTASEIGDYVPWLMQDIGKTNSNTFTNIENAAPGTMRFRGCRKTGAMINRKYWEIIYEFEYNPDGFDDDITSQKLIRRAKTVPVLDEDDKPDGSKTAVVSTWLPDGSPESRTLDRGSVDFSWLNGRLSWW